MYISVNQTLSLKIVECGNCGTQYAMRSDLYKGFEQSKKTFYCPNGHEQYFGGKSEVQILKEQLHQKEQELSAERRLKNDAEYKLSQYKNRNRKQRKNLSSVK